MKRIVPGWRRSTRLSFVVLAILAVSLLPLRALCDLGLAHAAQTTSTHHSGDGDGEPAFCCTNIEDRALVDSVVPGLSGGPSATPFVALLASVLILSGIPGKPLRLVRAPPTSRSYYARSARILR